MIKKYFLHFSFIPASSAGQAVPAAIAVRLRSNSLKIKLLHVIPGFEPVGEMTRNPLATKERPNETCYKQGDCHGLPPFKPPQKPRNDVLGLILCLTCILR